MSQEPDLTLLFPGDGEMAGLMRAKDWASTSLGAVTTWPHALRAAVRTMLTSRFAMWMGWGDELGFFYNDAYRTDTLGSKHPRALGRPTREVWTEIWTEVAPRIESMQATGRATWDEGLLLMLERDGYREETYHTFSYSPLHDDEGRIRGVLCVVVEETSRVLSERRVALLGKLSSELAATNTDDGVVDALRHGVASDPRDLPFTLTYLFDERHERATLAAHTGFDTAPTTTTLDLAAAGPWPLRELLERGQPLAVDLAADAWPRGRWPSAPTRALLLPIAQQGQASAAGVLIAGINPHRALDDAYRGFLGLLVGQLAAGLANARAYERERQRAESLSALDRAKTTFFSNVSHEFRTPLTLMLGPLDDLLGDLDLTPHLRDELATINRNALRLLKLVNTMLDFSRIEAGRAVSQIQPLDLAQLTTDLASVFRSATERAGLQLVVDCPPLDGPVAVDRDMWEKIVLNLLSNAFKFTLHGEIAVGLARRSDQIELTVRDTGCGIPATELGHVFERFHRVEGTRGRSHEGTGIGLALVQELVRLHGGTIAVASELGQGTTFTVSIPRGAGAAAPHPLDRPAVGALRGLNVYAEEAMRWLPDAVGTIAAPPGRAYLLVVDDNSDMRGYLQRLLGRRWEVDTVANGRAALASIRVRRPDLVLTDVMMPELDGFGLIAAIRAEPDLRDVPVIVLSARAGEEARVEGLQHGANEYLVKPFAARELVAHVETQLMRAVVASVEHAQARRFAAVFEQTPVAIAILRGPTHVYETANPSYLGLIEGRPVMGRAVADALPEVVAQGIIELLDDVYRTGVPYVAKARVIQLRRRDGTPRPLLYLDFVYQPLRRADGVIDGIAVVVHDVSELALARGAAETANQAKDEFLAMLGHELRNPLAPITTALHVMKLRGVGGERERAVIERQVHHMVGLIDDLLDVSRITRGMVELRMEPVELADVVARAIEVVSPLLETQRHALAIEVPRGLVVLGDATRLAQVVSNLLANAAKYTPKAGRIAVTAWPDGDGHAMLRVVDNGIGIDAATLPRIFEPFAQAKQALDRSQGGLGLGLAIVANLIKLHGGTVHAASEGAGRGSELTVRLRAIEVPAELGVVRSGAPRGHHARDVRVLVVDDNVDAAELLAEALAADGFQTHAAFDGPSALEHAAAFRPQIAVLDLGLPVMDGFELARLLRAHPILASTKLVAVTGYGQPQDRAQTTSAGFSAHLVKPVDLDKLREVIRGLLSS